MHELPGGWKNILLFGKRYFKEYNSLILNEKEMEEDLMKE